VKKVFSVPVCGEIHFDVEKQKHTTVLRWTVCLAGIGSSSYGLVVENDEEGREFVRDYIDSLTDDIAAEKALDLIKKTLEHLEVDLQTVVH
jgi:hypothetical protein